MQVDADGAPDAYHQDNIGRDHLANAGKPGNWWALVTDTGRTDGIPLRQGPGDPAPGFFISMTALEDASRARTDPRRYVNSVDIPYIVLPRGFGHGVRLGDLATVVHPANGKLAQAIYADIGPRDELGEGSIALATALGVNPDPRRGGTARGLVYIVYPGSGNGRPASAAEIATAAADRFRRWGDTARLDACLASGDL